MEEALRIINDYWPLLVGLVVILAKIANVSTKYWPEWKPAFRWLGFLVEVLDVVRVPQIQRPLSKESNVKVEAEAGNRPTD